MLRILTVLLISIVFVSCGYFEDEKASVKTYAEPWPDGIIKYYLDAEISTEHSDNIKSKFNDIEGKTKVVKFVDVVNPINDAVHIKYGNSTQSTLGYGTNLSLTVQPERFNEYYASVLYHEIFHILGFWHENQRIDADTYVEIIWENVHPSLKGNFYKREMLYDIEKFQYDVNSVVHYGRYDCGILCRETLIFIGDSKDVSLAEPTELDYLKLADIYGSE